MNTVVRMLALVGLGLLLGAADSWIRPVQLRLRPHEPAITSPAAQDAASPASAGEPDPTKAQPAHAPAAAPLGLEITIEQARSLYDQGVTFLDARLEQEFNVDRVAGAQQLTTDMFGQDQPPPILNILDPAAPVVIYCSGGDCDASHSVGIRLQQAGFERIHIMTDGLPGWKNAGYPIESGPPAGG